MNNLIISNELMSVVLGKEVKDVHETIDQPNMIVFNPKWYEGGMAYTNAINKYEMADRVKKWIYDNNFHIETRSDKISNYLYLSKIYEDSRGYSIDKSTTRQFDGNGDIIDLFCAGEWVIKNV